MHILLSEKIKSALTKARLYVINFQCIVNESDPFLWKEIEQFSTGIKNSLLLEEVNKIETIAATRNAYKKCGKDPNRYRPSADSLIRRIVKGSRLYKVNSIVDVLNFISI
jgi:DNA/RNA-binding domain of Phe-tRNA-synthetase-like protein